jgi:hypothetical protein
MTTTRAVLFILFTILLLLSSSIFAIVPVSAPGDDNWTIDGTKVYIDDSRVYLEADPHTIASPGWVTFTLQSKLYTGDIDVVWGFDTTTVKPSKAEIYKPDYNNWTSQYIEWQPFAGDFTIINQEHGGMNTWYVLKNVPVAAGTTYTLRAWVDVPISTEGVSGKYWWCIKQSTLSLTEAIEQDKFYSLDPWYNVAYSHRKTIRITNPTAEILTNFPVFVNVSYESEMQNDFEDCTFTSLSNDLLPFELDDYIDSDYGLYWANVTIPASSYVDVYMYYGNPGASSLQNPEGVWDSNYVLVTHMRDSPDSSHVADSTAYSNDGTKLAANEPAETAAGAVGRAQSFDGSNDYTAHGQNSELDFIPNVDAFTLSCFAKIAPTKTGTLISKAAAAAATRQYQMYVSGNTLGGYIGGVTYDTGVNVANNEYHYLVLSNFDDSGTKKSKCYIDGVADDTIVVSGSNTADYDVLIGARRNSNNADYGYLFNGTIDEVRVSNVARSANWIKSGYEFVVNQSTYVTFSGGETCPCPPTIANETGNFWVNFTFTPDNTGCPLTTDGYNVSWGNGTDNGWINTTSNYINFSLSPHECMNLTVWSWNATENVSSCDYAIAYACVPNNAPVISGCDNIFFNGTVVLLELNYTDADGDICTFSTDCPYGSLNPITGEFIWNITGNEAGIQSANFTVNDSYGGSDMCVASFMDIFLYLQNLHLVEEQDMLAQMWLFLVLLLIDFAFVFFVFFEIRDIFYGDGTVTIASILASLLSVVLSFILSFQSLLTPVEMPALNYFMLAVAMVMSIIFIRFIIQVIAMSLYAMRAKNF